MTHPTDTIEVDYPETDGLPMGETALHRYWMNRIHDLLQHRYRGQRVLAEGNLFLYYVEGDRTKVVCPDEFVVKDCDPRPLRDTFLLWKEPHPPHAVFEVTSKSTRGRDLDDKPAIYAEIGVGEFFLYDPQAEYLDPPLQGFRLVDGAYEQIEEDDEGRVASEELDLWLALDGNDLVLTDRPTGAPLLTAREAAESARQAAEARWLDEKAAREAETEAREAETAAREAVERALEGQAAALEALERALEAQKAARESEREAAQTEIERLRRLVEESRSDESE